MAKRFEVGTDIGGTFTDFVLLDQETGEIHIGKHLTSVEPSDAVMEGLIQLMQDRGITAADLRRLVHATTLATNTIISRSGSKTGLITTEGFRDSLEIGHGERYDIYDLFIRYPDPIVPRDLRLEAKERLLRDGSVHIELDEATVAKAVRQLVEAGVESVAVSYIHAYANPAHERRTREIIHQLAPELVVDLSSEICPESGEFTRTSTTVVNAYVKRRMEQYLTRLEDRLSERGFEGAFHMVMSNGATCTFANARQYPVRLIESGPAGGALVAAFFGRLVGKPDIISFDMGGTTAKCSLIRGGRPEVNYDFFEVDRIHRFGKGSGIPIRTPSIDMIEIGAGGGSIARVDELGLLKVGPHSAESNPGPACYNRGGKLPTVSDSNLVLGYLNPAYFLGGRMKLDLALAHQAIEEHLAKPLGMDLVRAAWGIHEIVTENMASAARSYMLEKGEDPRKYAILGYGGGGPLHACRLAQNIRSNEVICPLGAGVASALGILIAPLAFDMAQAEVTRLESVDWHRLEGVYADFEAGAQQQLRSAGVEDASIHTHRHLDLRYAGQGYSVTVELPAGPLSEGALTAVRASFEKEYRRLYGQLTTTGAVETVAWRGTVTGQPGDFQVKELPARESGPIPVGGSRKAYFPEAGGYVDTTVYDRYALRAGDSFMGPAIVEERESTVIVIPGWSATVDQYGNLRLQKQSA